jgi:hypothetical protein
VPSRSGRPARHPERVAGLIIQNANAYQEGLSGLARQMIANQPGVPGAEHNIRQVLELPVTRSQYETGPVPPTAHPQGNPRRHPRGIPQPRPRHHLPAPTAEPN